MIRTGNSAYKTKISKNDVIQGNVDNKNITYDSVTSPCQIKWGGSSKIIITVENGTVLYAENNSTSENELLKKAYGGVHVYIKKTGECKFNRRHIF